MRSRLRWPHSDRSLQTDKVGKAFKYLDAVLSLIECGIAMELEGPATRSVYSVYSEAVDLVK